MKAQATVFILLGIILLIGGAIGGYYITKTREQRTETLLPKISELPTELQPAASYYQDCIRKVARDGLRKLGEHGGYITTKGLITNPYEPTGKNVNAVNWLPNTEGTAYWHYLSSENNCEKTGTCEYSSHRPELSDIQKQLEEYVNSNIEACIQNFNLPGYKIKPESQPKTNVRITPKTVIFVVEHALKIDKQGTPHTISQFYYEEPLNLKEIYQLATDITNKQREDNFLEHKTQDIIDAYAGLDSELPPTNDIRIGLSAPVFWTKIEMIKAIQEMLKNNIPLIQVLNTGDYNFITAPAAVKDKQLYEKTMNWDNAIMLQNTYNDLGADFLYFDSYTPYFDINCRGQVCRPEGILTDWFPIPFGFQRTRFAYDVSYPVMVEIYNPEAFNRQGYYFRIFIEANIRNNRALTAEYQELITPPIQEESEYCEQTKWETKTEITLKDGYTLQPINDAGLVYECGQEKCNIGKTTNGKFEGKMPTCIGGTLTALHQAYQSIHYPIDTDTNTKAELEMYSFKEVEIDAKTYLIEKSGNTYLLDSQNPRELHKNEEAIITLTRQEQTMQEPHSTAGRVKGDKFAQKDELSKIRLLPGKYEVRIIATAKPEPPWTIPPDNRCYDTGWFSEDCFDIPKEEIRFDKDKPFPTGDTTLEWEITPNMLKNAKKATFKYIGYRLQELPNKIEALEPMGKQEELSTIHANKLEPELE